MPLMIALRARCNHVVLGVPASILARDQMLGRAAKCLPDTS